jgi:hypothetical protein
MKPRLLRSKVHGLWYPLALACIAFGLYRFVGTQTFSTLNALWSCLGLGAILLTSNLSFRHWLYLTDSGLRRFPGFGHPSLRWSRVHRVFLTGERVAYELVPAPGELNEYPDEYITQLPTHYGLTAFELIDLLASYKRNSAVPETNFIQSG